MFDKCSNLVSLDISNFDTGSVTNMTNMLTGCSSLEKLTLGEGFFKTPHVTSINLGDLSNWTQDSFIQSVVMNSYDRATNGLPNLEIVLHPNVYAYLTDEHKATLTSKGYVITPVSQDPDNEE
jgi:surface protein